MNSLSRTQLSRVIDDANYPAPMTADDADGWRGYEAERADLARLLETVNKYLLHPDVTCIPFAVRSEVVAVNVELAIEALKR